MTEAELIETMDRTAAARAGDLNPNSASNRDYLSLLGWVFASWDAETNTTMDAAVIVEVSAEALPTGATTTARPVDDLVAGLVSQGYTPLLRTYSEERVITGVNV